MTLCRQSLLVATALLFAFTLACENDVAPPPPPDDQDALDVDAPEPIDDLALAFDTVDKDVVLTWTARRDDSVHARPDRYDIRYSESFPFDWEQSTPMPDPPPPLAPGATQEFVFADPRRGRDFYASIRAIDAAGNQSLLDGVAHVRVPGYWFEATCLDALSGAPVEGLDATITTRNIDHVTSGADGRITALDLASGTLAIVLNSGSAVVPYHDYSDVFTLRDDITISLPAIPFQLPQSPLFTSILSLLTQTHSALGEGTKRWSTFPVPWYAADFVNVHGLDYRAITERAAERWNTRLGFQMFAPVASDPSPGVLIEFKPRSAMGIQTAFTDYGNDANGYPLHDRIWVIDELADEARLYSIMMHELGHTIRLNHLPAGFIMYGSQPLPGDISDDEVTMVQLLLALPNGINLTKYDASPPTP